MNSNIELKIKELLLYLCEPKKERLIQMYYFDEKNRFFSIYIR